MPAYEATPGDALEAIEALCRHLLPAGSGFSATTHPTMQEVEQYQSMAYYRVAGLITTMGYQVQQTAVDALGWLQQLQVLNSVILVELSYPISGAGQPSARFTEFVSQRDMLEQMFIAHEDLLEDLGGIRNEELGQYTEVTGTSRAEKLSVRQDEDFVPFRFNRGWGQYPGIPVPGTTDWERDSVLGG